MVRNYLIIAFRNLSRHRAFSLLNVLGLAIGMMACLFILQYVGFEWSYDRFHTHAADVYRVANDRYQNGKLIQHGTITYSAVGKALNDDFEEVIANARVKPQGGTIIAYGGQKFPEEQSLAVDHSFLRMFSFPLRAGNREDALKEPYTVVITETLARKIFNYKGHDYGQFLGKSLQFLNGGQTYRITGICQDVPPNSHLQFKVLISYATLVTRWKATDDHSFTASDFWHYVQLKPGTDYRQVEAKLAAFSQRHFQGNKVSGSDEKFYLQPLLQAHLYSDFEYEIGVVGNGTVVWGLFIIALFIMAIAWINYINLSTAKAVERAKEVGVRKVMGAHRGQLIGQFLAEAFIINGIGLLIALLLVLVLQPAFNQLLDRPLSLASFLAQGLGGRLSVMGLALILVAGVLLSGFYPAFVLSAYQPVTVLKGKLGTSRQGVALRKGLVVGQFAATIVLIIGSLMVYRQIRYMSEKELGLNMDQILVVQAPRLTADDSTFSGRVESFKDALKGVAGVKAATTTRNLPGDELGRAFNVHRKDAAGDPRFTARLLSVNYDFTDVYEIKMLAGRKFSSSDHAHDWDKLHNLVINAKAVQLLGFASPQAAIGKSILVFDNKPMNIVGVMADYHQKSLHSPIEPILLFPSYGTGDPISVKVTTRNLPRTLASIRQQYGAFFPGNVFDYFFLDEKFNQQYKDDQLFGRVFGLFAGFAIFVACLGLFGLSLFTVTQRAKEMGIRKVLGASVPQLVGLLSRDFLQLVLIAFLIATPVAWYMMHQWLKDFAYRVAIEWWIFVLAGVLATSIALITVSFQSIKAALMNPIKSLRSE